MASGPIDAKLVISAETRQAFDALKRLQTGAKGVREELGKTSGGTVPFAATRRGLDSISRQLATVRTQIVAFLAAQVSVQTLRGLAEMADRYEGIHARLRLATNGEVAYQRAVARTTELSKQYQRPLADTATLYSRVAGSLKGMSDGQERAEATTEGLLASLKITGATTAEQASAIQQLSQALGAGAIQGEEFNSMADAAPRLLEALATAIGRPRGELKELAAEGRLTTRVVTEAIMRQLPRLRAEAAAIPDAIVPAFNQVGDAIGKVVGEANRATGASLTVVAALKTVAANMDGIVKAGGAVVAVIAAMGLGRLATGLLAAATAAKAAAGGATLLAGASGAVAVAWRGLLGLIGGPVGLVVMLGSLAAAWLGVRKAQRDAAMATVDGLEKEKARLQAELTRLESGKRDEQTILPPGTRHAITRTKKELTELDAKLDEMRGKEKADREAAAQLEREGRRGEGSQPPIKLDDPQDKKDRARRDQHIARARESYDKERELLADSLERQRQVNEQAFEDGLKDLQRYLAERARLEDQAVEVNVARLGDQLAAERRAVRENEAALVKERDPDDRGRLEDAIAQGKSRVAEIEADITRQQRDQADAAAARLRDARQLTDELRRQQQQVQAQLAETLGQDLTPDQIRSQVMAEFEDQIRRIRQLGGDDGAVLKLVDVEATRRQLEQVAREYERVQTAIALREQAISQQVSDGTLTQADAEQQLLSLRREQLPVLDEILARLQSLAQSPDDQQRVERLRAEVAAQRDLRTELERTARSAAVDGIAQMLTDVVTGAKRGREALLDMVQSFARTMLNVINQRLAEQLVNQFLGATSGAAGASSGGGWAAAGGLLLAGLLFHSGGIAGESSGPRRALPASTWALAPRYHGGGIAGLAPDEVPAVLRRGEEVLTEDNPRHSRNVRSVGGVSVVNNIEINGAGGDAARQREAGDDLARSLDAAMDAWATRQKRPGGILSGM